MVSFVIGNVFKCKVCGRHHLLCSSHEIDGLCFMSCTEQRDQTRSYIESDFIPIYGGIQNATEREFLVYDELGARIMTPLEVFGVDSDGLVYVETCGAITPALVTDRTCEDSSGRKKRWLATQQLNGDWLYEDLYGISWRCWNKRPLEEQRDAAKWEGRKDE